MLVVTTAQMRHLEQAAVDAGATWPGLLEQAGWGVAQVAFGLIGPAVGTATLVLVGPGNNGGDGLVVARHLHDAGAAVAIYLWHRNPATPDPNLERCRERDIMIFLAENDPDCGTLRRLLGRAALVVDALLGMGVNRPAANDLAAIITTLNDAHTNVLSVDLPSGVLSDTGTAPGPVVQATMTVATGLPKRGVLLYPGRSFAGRLNLAALDLPPVALETIMSETLTAALAQQLLPARPADSHKGTYGKALVVAGSAFYPGAATLATTAAARVGAGLVTLASGRSVLSVARIPEITLIPLPEADWGVLGESAAVELLKKIDSYTALLVGPGLGHEDATGLFIQRLFGLDTPRTRGRLGFTLSDNPVADHSGPRPDLPPTVIDADGLNLLAQIEDWHERIPRGRLVLTPHPGEMRRLLKTDTLDADSVQLAADAAARWGQVVVLKGATTVIASPEGRTLIHAAGNPALATAGTGDVLAGAIVGLLAQGLAPFAAATLGVFLHGAAGARVRDEIGDTGALASDLLLRLPTAIKTLRQGS